MLLTIDIGNTNTVLRVFDGERVIDHWRMATVPDGLRMNWPWSCTACWRTQRCL